MEDKRNLQKPFKGQMHIGCLNCSPVTRILEMKRAICVGFGAAVVKMDDEVIYEENPRADFTDIPIAQTFEDMAKKEPNHDWRIWFHAPLHEEEYQRQDDGKWVMISSGPGFA